MAVADEGIRRKQPSTLRAQLTKLTIIGLLPLVLFCGALVVLLARQERDTLTRGLQETARALSGALQEQFESTVTTLSALGSSEALDRGAIKEFRTIAARALDGQDGWGALALMDGAGVPIFSIGKGKTMRFDIDRESLAMAIRDRRPLASNFAGAPALDGAAQIYVPVQREGRIVHVLSAAIERRVFSEILARQKISHGSIGTIFDRRKTIVARTREPERYVGTSVGPVLQQLDPTRQEGVYYGESLEGPAAYAAISTLPRSGWSVALIVPAAQVNGPLWRSLGYVMVLGLISLALGIALAALFARRIAAPIHALSISAKALGEGRFAPAARPGEIRELALVAQDLERAGELLQARSRERDRVEAELRERDAFLERQTELLRQSEEKLRRQAGELEQQLLASGRLVAVGELTASMAHEFNNPLGIILGFAQGMLADMDPADPLYPPIKIIADETQRCEKLVKELLEFGRPRKAEFAPVDLRSVLERTVELIASRAAANNVKTTIDATGELPPLIADAQQLQQLFLNLCLNAVDAMPRGGALTIAAACGDAGNVQVAVADTGIGIEPEMQEKIFQPFVTAKKRRGLGLGLPICDRIVKAHGGAIEVRSQPGQGTTFVITLPTSLRRAA